MQQTVVQEAVSDIVAQAGPNALYRSISWLDAHPGHNRIGYAVRDACASSGLSNCLYFQSPLYQNRSEGLGFRPVETPMGQDYPIGKFLVDRAVAAYRTKSPADGRFAVGWESVQGQIAWIDKYDTSWGHGLVWRSAEVESAASDWIVSYQRRPRREPRPGMAALGFAIAESTEPDLVWAGRQPRLRVRSARSVG